MKTETASRLTYKAVSILLGTSLMLLSSTAVLAQGTHRTTPIDIAALGQELEEQFEYVDQIKYSVPGADSLAQNEQRLNVAGQRAYSALLVDAQHESIEKKPMELGVVSIDYEFDSYEVESSSPTELKVDMKYFATRETEDVKGDESWQEEVIYGLTIDPTSGQVVNIVNKDTDWLHDNLPDEEVVVDDGLGSGSEGLSSDEMLGLDQASAERHAQEAIPYDLSYYQRMNVKHYANAWWNGRNPNFVKYGKDCTNFTSQALHHGGWKMVFGNRKDNRFWWANKLNSSWAWSGAENFYKFAIHHSKRSHLHHHQDTKYLREGDIVQYKDPGKKTMTHSMVVTGIDSRGILVTYHSRDTHNRPIRELFKPGRIWYPHKI